MNKHQKTVDIIVSALEDVKGHNIVVQNTESKSQLFSYMIFCSGTSSRQTAALARNVVDELKNNNIPIVSIEGERNGDWVLVDCGDVVVHVMLGIVREYYNLEELWGNANNLNAQE